MSLVAPTPPVPIAQLGDVHLVGIGGAGMSGIARVLLRRGVRVSGSDAKDSPVLAQLRELGARVHVGHAAEYVGDADTLVVSSAIRPDNPELAHAQARGLRVLPRAAALGALLLDRRGIAVAGTHGKTSTTSMLTVLLRELGAEPGYVIGGVLSATGIGADAGTGDIMVVEADESDGSFLMLAAQTAVVTNVEADHLDNYGGIAEIHANFARFVERVSDTLIIGVDDPGARKLAELAAERGLTFRTFGEAPQADYRISDITADGFATSFTLTVPEHAGNAVSPAAGGAPAATPPGPGLRCTIAAPGRHNALNAAAAIAAADAVGYPPVATVPALAAFTGAARRFELKGERGGVRVVDSYAHHPTEIAADLRAARAALLSTAGEHGAPTVGRIVAVFQPHLFSRTRIFAAEFAEALSLADEVVVLPIYAAREDPEPGVTSELITKRVSHDRVRLHRDRGTVAVTAARLARPGDVVLTMGAGDVTEVGPEILTALETAVGGETFGGEAE